MTLTSWLKRLFSHGRFIATRIWIDLFPHGKLTLPLVIVDIWSYGDYLCAVIKYSTGSMWWYSGYVGVPPSHPLFHINYNEQQSHIYLIEVHGGLTFLGYRNNIKPGYWFFGFDYAHVGDYSMNLSTSPPVYTYHIRLDDVIADTNRLADQLARWIQWY